MKLGVGITYFNERELFTECLNSLKGQFPDEILVFDDASEFPAQDYVPAEIPVRIIRSHSNVGPSRGRNRLLAESGAGYLHFQDADDRFSSGWTGAVRDAATRNPDLILTEVSGWSDSQLVAQNILQLEELRKNPDLILFALHHAILPAAATYRTDFLRKAGGYREDLWQSEDYELHVRLAALGASCRIIPQALVLRNGRTESRSQKLNEVWECRLQGLLSVSSQLPVRYEPEIGEAFAYLGSMLFRLGDRVRARQAFYQACHRKASYRHQQLFYRMAARLWGPVNAERLAAAYRSLVPTGIRHGFRTCLSAVTSRG